MSELDEYRKSLIEIEQRIGAGYDKTLIPLSGGALGLTVTFIKDIVTPASAVNTWLAVSAWSAWAISLASLLLALCFGTSAYRHAITMLDNDTLDSKKPGGFYTTLTTFFNISGGLSFLAGVVLFIYFTYSNFG